MLRLFTTCIFTTMAIVISANSCQRAENLTFEDFDKDNDNVVDVGEFEETFTANFYNDWNVTDDQYLDDEDFMVSTYDVWDTDDDDLLTEDEWNMGYDYYYGDYVDYDFNAVDIDGDGFVEYTEYDDALIETNYFQDWDNDVDGYLTETELAYGVFNRWDLDNDGVLEPNEYRNFDSYYLDI